MKRNMKVGLAVALATVLATGSVRAQIGQPPQGRPGITPQASPQDKDQQIAEWLAADTFVSAETAALGKEYAKSDKVKEFAEKVSEEHKKACEKLKEASPGATVQLGDGNSNDRSQGQAFGARRPGSDSRLDPSETKKKIARKRVQMIKKELRDHDGDKFDAAFLGVQAIQHQNLIAALEVMEEDASPQLREVLKSKRETAEKHCEQAKELMKELRDS